MTNITNELRLLNSNDEVLASITAITYYDESNEFDEGETFYLHPLTSSECDTVGQILVGWYEQDQKDQDHWEQLVEEIRTDKELSVKIFNLDVIDYYN